MTMARTDLAAELAGSHIVTVDNFLPLSVCRRMLREASAGDWVPSGVAATSRAAVSYASGRSSSTHAAERNSAFIEAGLRRIEDSLLTIFGIRPSNLEPWQVTRYQRGEAFDYHLDCGGWRRHPSGERRRTILVYLEQPIRGGATDFRALRKTISPVPGRLVVWNNLLPTGRCNHGMIHSSRPVWQGRKTILTTWERERRYVQ
jgi:prolyl 4-hydroxylase